MCAVCDHIAYLRMIEEQGERAWRAQPVDDPSTPSSTSPTAAETPVTEGSL